MKYSLYLWLGILFLALAACEKDEDPEEVIPPTDNSVQMDLDALPYDNLSGYKFFIGDMKELEPNDRVLYYEPITPLFSDYAHKKRFIWMPVGTQATYSSDGQILDFPDGTVMVKVFYYDHVEPDDSRRIVETRLLYKKGGLWEFAEYVWNDEQTEAIYDPVGSYTDISFTDDNGVARDIQYRVPSMNGNECLTCHKKNSLPIPIGPKPQNLNMSMDYGNGMINQLEKWADMGYLDPSYPADIQTVVDWTDPSESVVDRVRAYIDMNCAHCHAEGSHCDYRPMRFAYSETETDENLGICVSPDEVIPGQEQLLYIIARGNTARSMLSYRINATDEAVRMPLLGRSIVHDEAVALIDSWIESLDPECN